MNVVLSIGILQFPLLLARPKVDLSSLFLLFIHSWISHSNRWIANIAKVNDGIRALNFLNFLIEAKDSVRSVNLERDQRPEVV
jgi:hypothetical protein